MAMPSSSETQSKLQSFEGEQVAQQNRDLDDHQEECFSYAMQLVNSVVLPMALQTAIELKVFDVMSKSGPGARLSAGEIATQVSSKNPEAPTMLDRILRLLASHSVIHCSVVVDHEGFGSFQRLYGLNPVSRYFVANDDGVSLGPLMALIQDKVFLQSWSQLKEAIVEGGIPFNRVYGMHAFEYPRLDPRFNEVFNTAMTNYSSLVVHNILKSYKGFEQQKLQTLVDVGGGLGVTLNLIISKYPHIQGINFDLPHVIREAPSYPGVEHVGGDMFQSVPKGDAIFMKSILHDWSDEQCFKLLENCYNAIPDDGKVIVVEAVLPIMPDTSALVKTTYQDDVLMMTQNPGGRERNEQELTELAIGSGFSGIRYDSFVCDLWVMEFFK